MPLVVTCGSCGSRFRLKETLLEGTKGARIRCRNCGEYFVVRKNGEPPEPEAGKIILQVEDLFLPLNEVPAPLAGEKPRARFRILLTGVLSALAISAAMLFFLGQKPFQAAPVKSRTAPAGSAAERPVYEIRDTEGYPGRSADGQSFFVVHGTVANVGKGPSDGIRVRASLLGTDNQVILEGESFAGNLIDKAVLPHMTRVRIDEFLGVRYGDWNSNRNIPEGGSLPFMVVFFDPPGPVGSFIVRATDAGEPVGL